MAREISHSEMLDDDFCFACGSKNPLGLRLTFRMREDGRLETRFTPQPHHQGFRGILHGGIAAAIVDDLMSNHGSRLTGRYYLTAELTVRYRRPLPIGEELVATSRLVNHRHRLMELEAEITIADNPDRPCFTARGRFLELEPGEEEKVSADGGGQGETG